MEKKHTFSPAEQKAILEGARLAHTVPAEHAFWDEVQKELTRLETDRKRPDLVEPRKKQS